MKRLTLVAVLVMLVAGMVAADVEMWIDRVEVNGRLLIPLRGVFEAAGATVDYYAATRGIEITMGSTLISMYVGNTQAYVNGVVYYMDVAPRVIGGSTYIPLRFVGEALGMSVDYAGNTVVLSGGGLTQRIILHIRGGGGGPPPPSGEILPQSNDRSLTNGDLAGLSNWQCTLARNEIYARHGRPFNNDHIRAYFQSTGWYHPNPAYRDSWLSATESRNATFILNYQNNVFGGAATHP